MTKEELEQYRKRKKRLEKLEKEIKDLCEREVPTMSGKVTASSKDFPYSPYRVSVLIADPREDDKIKRRVIKCKNEVAELKVLLNKVDVFIDSISDSEIKTIFEMRYLNGDKLPKIAETLGMDRSTIGKKITSFLKLSPLSHF